MHRQSAIKNFALQRSIEAIVHLLQTLQIMKPVLRLDCLICLTVLNAVYLSFAPKAIAANQASRTNNPGVEISYGDENICITNPLTAIREKQISLAQFWSASACKTENLHVQNLFQQKGLEVALDTNSDSLNNPLSQSFLVAQQSQATLQTILQQQGSLQRGDSVLDDGSLYDEYPFEGEAGQQVVITLESSAFDTFLILVAPNGDLIAQNDDISTDNLNSSLTVTLPSSGTYRVVANSYDSSGRGRYMLTVSSSTQVTTRNPQTSLIRTAESLPDGDYLFENISDPRSYETSSGNIEFIFRKRGNTVVGIVVAYLDQNSCLRGEVRENMISNVVMADYFYSITTGDTEWEFSSGQPFSLNDYQMSSDAFPEYAGSLLQDCLEAYRGRS